MSEQKMTATPWTHLANDELNGDLADFEAWEKWVARNMLEENGAWFEDLSTPRKADLYAVWCESLPTAASEPGDGGE